ncbi:hypothetical protein JCM19238_509 [Vibrio ponticus]|nr:hypothetical protein JCM19238_509 [Vibrio ponticus]
MPKQKAGYEDMFDDVVEALKHSPDEVNHVLETSGKYVDAANDMTKDELALISAYVKSDLKEFANNYEESKKRSLLPHGGRFHLARFTRYY